MVDILSINPEITISLIGLVGVIVAAIVAGVSPLVLVWFKDRLDKRKDKEKMKNFVNEIKFGALLEQELEYKRIELGCERIWLTQFHNGGVFYPTNKSIQKSSMVYEVIDKNKVKVDHLFQNIPINMFARAMNYLLEHPYINIGDTGNYDRDEWGMKGMYNSRGTKSAYLFSIKSTSITNDGLQDRFIGLLGIDFDEVVELGEEELELLCEWVNNLGSVLMAHLES